MSDAVQERPATEEDGPLRRVIGRKLLLVFIIGDILGAGVYALTGKVAARSEAPCGSRSSLPSRWRP